MATLPGVPAEVLAVYSSAYGKFFVGETGTMQPFSKNEVSQPDAREGSGARRSLATEVSVADAITNGSDETTSPHFDSPASQNVSITPARKGGLGGVLPGSCLPAEGDDGTWDAAAVRAGRWGGVELRGAAKRLLIDHSEELSCY